ncbi:MAG: threonine-phosphate decarboxylase [Pseudomonadota bacterium]
MAETGTVAGRDHGGGLDAAIARHGGSRKDWIDLSTGINPVPYPVPALPAESWTALPDMQAELTLLREARAAWRVPDGADILAAPGASALIARLPGLAPRGVVHIPEPTYNEHAAAFSAQGWEVHPEPSNLVPARVLVHPNNPTGHWYTQAELDAPFTIVDESFADVAPDRSLVGFANRPGTLILKSFGKFWGLAGLRLGFAIGPPDLIASLRDALGPWPVSGPALSLGAIALADRNWAQTTRARLNDDAARLDALMQQRGAASVGGTSLFRLYEVSDAADWQARLAHHHIWSRVFPYSRTWLRLGLPAPQDWSRLEAAL